jgi:hypothetical protein
MDVDIIMLSYVIMFEVTLLLVELWLFIFVT